MQWREGNGSRWLEAGLPGTRAAFTTRLGGVSEGPFESLNIGMKTDDELGRVRENRQRVSAAVGIEPERVLMGHQVHGAELAWHDEPQRPSPFAETLPAGQQVDAQATATPGLAVLVQVADCLPIALAGERGVVMVHGGWRGLAAGIVGRAAEAVGATAAAIGPGIGPCCYEVGDEVLAALGVVPRKRSGGVGQMLDLTAVAQARLQEAGIGKVESSGLCTSCNPELFFSHRRDNGTTGRQAGLAWIEA
ncbi:MAG: polyphenol oxidase family protein [Solirubrobacterales bacterium]